MFSVSDTGLRKVVEFVPHFNYIRAFSAIMIVCCHLCFLLPSTFFLGVYLSSFVEVFIILSAILLGKSQNKEKVMNISFLRKRLKKICLTYYIYLFFLILYIYVLSGSIVSLKNIISHLLFIQYFTRSFDYSYGHLWFLTVIILCYVSVVVFSRMRYFFKSSNCILLVSFLLLIVECILLYCGINSRFIHLIVLFNVFFWRGDEILKRLKSINKVVFYILVFLSNLLVIYSLYSFLGLSHSKSFTITANFVISILNIAFLLLLFENQSPNRIVDFISGISFEIYLVHHPLLLGQYSLVNYFGRCDTIFLIYCVLIIIFVSFILRFISSSIARYF